MSGHWYDAEELFTEDQLQWKNPRASFSRQVFSCPRHNGHLSAILNDIALNPVRADLCEEVSEYRWPCARFHIGLESKNRLIKDRPWHGSPADWNQLLKSHPEKIDLLLRHFRTGRPLGIKEFLMETEKTTGRELIPKKSGRKKKSS